jgi:hypothetical protein
VRTRGGFGVFLGVTLPARRAGEVAMALSSPAQRSRPSISIRACTGTRIPGGQGREEWGIWRGISRFARSMDACAYLVLGDAGLADSLVVGLVAQPSHGGGGVGGSGDWLRAGGAVWSGWFGLRRKKERSRGLRLKFECERQQQYCVSACLVVG